MNHLSLLALVAVMLAGCGKGPQPPEQAPDERLSSTTTPTDQAKGETPRQRYEALRTEYDAARKAYTVAQREADDDSGRQKDASEKHGRLMAFSGLFFALAEQYPDDPVAFESRTTIATDRFRLDDEVRALGELVRYHIADPRLGQFCAQMHYLSHSPAGAKAEMMLREIVAKSPHAEVQARARFSLAEFLDDYAQFARYFQRHPDETGQPFFQAMLGEDGLKRLREGDADKFDEEAARLYELVIVRPAGGRDWSGSLEDKAKGRLFALRNLGIGRVAPDIVGTDLDGNPLRLSDLRGKVGVLNFWATWCGPCMALVPRERALVARLKGQPFVLVGVNCDKDAESAKKAAVKEEITWRSFADGDPATGPIVKSWGIRGWPTVYILDAKGVVRFKNVDFPNKDRFEDVVDVLLREAPGPQR